MLHPMLVGDLELPFQPSRKAWAAPVDVRGGGGGLGHDQVPMRREDSAGTNFFSAFNVSLWTTPLLIQLKRSTTS